ncbi:N-acetylglutamate synthase, mitochondrial-like [Pomacea canaliculata]|uniref:N-acetylglutamate synthase, mitochondrial-like n=1 Tax=Pomacea canaliculata TaxID=400727 RepID=UPI000D72A04B|nr:N-acetylglutamate synthase, mitochondrial-like [Pomacea canaliculata]XP_025091757.1 N-acetylglutamate synthase, mitochondrial-like [Pomacea canaliculata]XP_025091766.1 N-acetylglutamate synthase, mitochondrial-like [Pomacea canaliculata]
MVNSDSLMAVLTSAMKRNILSKIKNSLSLAVSISQQTGRSEGQLVQKCRQLLHQHFAAVSVINSEKHIRSFSTARPSLAACSTRRTVATRRKGGADYMVSFHNSQKYIPWNQTEFVPDLMRFLNEIGTDPKEARFWLKQFLNIDQKRPFAVVEVDSEVFADPKQLDHLASAISFLQRNALQPVVVFGNLSSSTDSTSLTVQNLRAASISNSCMLCDLLDNQGVQGRVLFAGSSIIQAEASNSSETVTNVNSDLIQWCIMRQTIPIIPAFGETSCGQIMPLRAWNITSAIAKALHPLKVIKVNCTGGFQDEKQHVIPNISLPFDFQAAKGKVWCTQRVIDTVQEISSLLYQLPEHTSVVITAADKVLVELFTHRGSGTFLKITEPVKKYHSLKDIDIDRLTTLLNKSFHRTLCKTYFKDIKDSIHTIYLSERYTAAAIILQREDCEYSIPLQVCSVCPSTGRRYW